MSDLSESVTMIYVTSCCHQRFAVGNEIKVVINVANVHVGSTFEVDVHDVVGDRKGQLEAWI